MKRWLHLEVHASWQLASASLGVVLGAVLTSFEGVVGVGWLLTAIALILTAVWRARRWTLALAVVGGSLLGLWRAGGERAALDVYQPFYEKTVQLQGTVSEDADIDSRGDTTVRLDSVMLGTARVAGKVWVSLGEKNDTIQRSDVVSLEGGFERGFGTFAGSMYRPKIIKIARPQPGDVALHIRNWFAGAVRHVIPEPQASLGIGYLVGQRRALPEELDNALQVAGLTHIVVASGYNLTILVRIARRIFEKISKYLAALSSSLMIISFIAVTGMSPSMSRAGLIAGLSLAAWYYGRVIHPLVLLPFAMAVTILVNPSYAWGDVGWQLSFAAFAGVIIMAPLSQAYYFGPKKPGLVRQVLGETLAAWLWTLPILAVTFGVVSNVAIFANMLVLPLVPLAMLLTFVAGIGALIAPSVGTLVAWPASTLLEYMTSVATFFAELSWAQNDVDVASWVLVPAYALLALWCGWMWWQTRLAISQVNIVD